MPHAEVDTASPAPMVNGEKSSSKAISHITSYPVVSDSITLYKSNAYGQKTIVLANSAYDIFGRPVTPYLKTPYSYVAPYLYKADCLADDGLTHVDTHFPIVKEDTETLKGAAIDFANLPFRLVGQGRDYLWTTWGDELSKTKGDGVVKYAKAAVSTELKIAIDGYHLVLTVLTRGKDEAKQVNEKVQN